MRPPAWAALFAALVFGATDGRAEGPAGSAPAVRAAPLSADVFRRLKSNDPAQIQSALDDVRMAGKGGGPAVPTIAALLKQGLSPALAQAAIDTLGDTENEAASDVLAWYARHRRSGLRRAAVHALAHTRGAVAVKALRAALSDSDPGVRGLSATALGSMRARDAVGELFVALGHHVPEAAVSIGQLCVGGDCERLANQLGTVPFDVVMSGLDQVLFRTPADVGDDVKLKIIDRVRDIGTSEANRFLRDVQSKWPASGSQRVKQSIDQGVLATSNSPGGSR